MLDDPKTPDGRRKKHGVPAMVERGAGDDHRWWNIYIYIYLYIYIYTHTYNMIYIYIYIRRKFRSETSDNMDS